MLLLKKHSAFLERKIENEFCLSLNLEISFYIFQECQFMGTTTSYSFSEPYFSFFFGRKKIVKTRVPWYFSGILEKFHFWVSSHFHFAFTTWKNVKTIFSLYTSRKRVKANTFHFSGKSESIFFHFSLLQIFIPTRSGGFHKKWTWESCQRKK